MADCEESTCANMQSAICLHCDKRLCTIHITAHAEGQLDEVQSLADKVNEFDQQLATTLEAALEICADAEAECETWKELALEKVQHLYATRMRAIANRRHFLNKKHHELTEQLSIEVKQPLEIMQLQRVGNMQCLDKIKLILQGMKQEYDVIESKNAALWSLPRKLKIVKLRKKKQIPNTPPSTPICDIENSAVLLPMSDQFESFKTNTTHPKPFKKMISRFGNVSSIDDVVLDTYLERSMKRIDKTNQHNKIIIVLSFVEAWYRHRTSSTIDRIKSRVSFIEKYVATNDVGKLSVILALQVFAYVHYHETHFDRFILLMLQFFLSNQCMTKEILLKWYDDGDAHNLVGYDNAKEHIKLFIDTLN